VRIFLKVSGVTGLIYLVQRWASVHVVLGLEVVGADLPWTVPSCNVHTQIEPIVVLTTSVMGSALPNYSLQPLVSFLWCLAVVSGRMVSRVRI